MPFIVRFGFSLRFFCLFACALLPGLLFAPAAHAQETGVETGAVTGVIVDGETGETLPGANVVVKGIQRGASTDLDGRYRIEGLAPGVYDLAFSFVSYQPKTVTSVEVSAGETATLDVTLNPATQELEEVVVTAEAARNTEAALLKERQKAATVSNAVSAEAISQAGSSTAAEAMETVTGASVIDGKHINVRGLGGRYVNTQLNGAELPSADPERNAVSFDLFPAGLLDNIVASKTFTPDEAGNFTGGSIDIATKSYPEELMLTLSSSVSYNSEVEPGSSILGVAGGAEEVPVPLQDGPVPGLGEARFDEGTAERLGHLSQLFASDFAPTAVQAPVSRSYSASFGNEFSVGGRPLGVVASLSYDRDISGYEDGRTGRYTLTGDVSTVEGLDTELSVTDRHATDETLIGGLATLSYKPSANHELGANVVYNRSDETSARFQQGRLPRDLSASQVYRTRTMRQTERTLRSVQGRGKHLFDAGPRGLRLEWNTSFSHSTQDDPDLRFFTDHFSPGTDTTYFIRPSSYPQPTRYFRDLDETTWSSDLSLALPFVAFGGRIATVKVGGSYLQKDRAFRERIFQYRQDAADYTGTPAQFTGDEVGMIGRGESGRYEFGYYLADVTESGNNYDGEQTLGAGFAMIDAAVLPQLRLVGGVRYETTHLSVATQGGNARSGILEEGDLLPSATLIYGLQDHMNLRLAYGRTLARPSFREFAPFSSFQFVGDYTLTGNPNLERTLIDNLDLRWEWFMRPGEVLAVSGFYKNFASPIERTVVPQAQNPEFRYANVGQARVYGLELELQQHLDRLSSVLEHFTAGANLTLVDSDVAIAPGELEQIRAYDPDAPDTRALQGQSPYVVNLNLGFEQPAWGTSVNAYYNRFGDRLDTIVGKGQPNFFEEERATVDLVAAQQLPMNLRLKLSAKNMFNAQYRVVQTFKEKAFVNEQHNRGRRFSLGLTYSL